MVFPVKSRAVPLGRRGLQVSNQNVPQNLKPKPLQASTNTIHAQKRVQRSLKQDDFSKQTQPLEKEKLKKKSQVLPEKKISKVDENDVSSFVSESYNPLLDFHPLDEDLYQKVLMLEVGDDGLPSVEINEPFDF